MLAVSLYLFGVSRVWGRVAVRVIVGVRLPRFQVDFSWGVRVLIVMSSGGEAGDFVVRVQSVDREMDWVVFSVESCRPAFIFRGCSISVRLSFRRMFVPAFRKTGFWK